MIYENFQRTKIKNIELCNTYVIVNIITQYNSNNAAGFTSFLQHFLHRRYKSNFMTGFLVRIVMLFTIFQVNFWMEIIIHTVQTGWGIDPMIHQTRIHILDVYFILCVFGIRVIAVAVHKNYYSYCTIKKSLSKISNFISLRWPPLNLNFVLFPGKY